MKNTFLLSLILLKTIFSSNAATWKTVSFGHWSNPGIWSGGVAPPFTCGDTLLILHPVVISNTITLTSGAYMKIDSLGGICGHETLIVQTNAYLLKYGILQLEALLIPGGHVNSYGPQPLIITNYAYLSNGGSMNITGGAAVGPWFNCQMPEYGFLTGEEETTYNLKIRVFPNPASQFVTFENTSNFDYVIFTDPAGRALRMENISDDINSFSLYGLPNGIYLLTFISNRGYSPAKTKLAVFN